MTSSAPNYWEHLPEDGATNNWMTAKGTFKAGTTKQVDWLQKFFLAGDYPRVGDCLKKIFFWPDNFEIFLFVTLIKSDNLKLLVVPSLNQQLNDNFSSNSNVTKRLHLRLLRLLQSTNQNFFLPGDYPWVGGCLKKIFFWSDNFEIFLFVTLP